MRIARPRHLLLLLSASASVAATAGCVRRTILITSDPDGALVYLNDQEVGRTPVEVDFTFYGDYDVRLEREGFEPIAEVGEANAPIWDTIPFDLVAEAVPGEPHSRIHWHYELLPAEVGREGLTDRAMELRSMIAPASAAGQEGAEEADDAEAADEAGADAADGQ